MRALMIPLLLILLPSLIYGIVMYYHRKKPPSKVLAYGVVMVFILFLAIVLYEALYKDTFAPHTSYIPPHLDGDKLAPASTR